MILGSASSSDPQIIVDLQTLIAEQQITNASLAVLEAGQLSLRNNIIPYSTTRGAILFNTIGEMFFGGSQSTLSLFLSSIATQMLFVSYARITVVAQASGGSAKDVDIRADYWDGAIGNINYFIDAFTVPIGTTVIKNYIIPVQFYFDGDGFNVTGTTTLVGGNVSMFLQLLGYHTPRTGA